MVTSAANPAWLGDVPVSNLRGAGLPAPSVVRPAKIMTLNDSGIVKRLGALPKADQVRRWSRPSGCSWHISDELLIREGRLTEAQLLGLSQDKLEFIRRAATL